MYEAFFDLHGRPFQPAPHADRYVAVGVIEEARLTLSRCIQRGEGPGLLIGPSGIGKTLLCQLLAREFADSLSVVQLACGRLGTRTALLQSILYKLGKPYRAMDEGELRLSLIDALEPSDAHDRAMLLIVDEGHTLPLRLLEEIRLLTNLVRDGQSRVRVVLAGSPRLEERFASPKLSSFAQRLAARCYLEPLNGAATGQYVRSQLEMVGGSVSKLLDDDVLQSIYRASDGIPRLINQICDHALLLASLGGAQRLTSAAIEEAWADLQQLPTPWSAGNAETSSEGVIEFGQLGDVDVADETPDAIPFRSAEPPALHVAETVEHDEDAGDDAPAEFEAPHAANSEPEVELDFPEFRDPLNEQFAEEEVVLDRYAADAIVFAGAPRVSCWESRQFAAMLEDAIVATAGNDVAAPEPISLEAVCPVDDAEPQSSPTKTRIADSTVDEMPNAEIASAIGPQDVAASHVEIPPHAVDEVDLLNVVTDLAAVTGADSFWADAKAAAETGEFLIIEDEPARPKRPAPKRQYRQLFAKLRRG